MSMQVASNGNSTATASGLQVLLGNNPATKLDVTNIASFQTIRLLFNNEPPQSPSSAPYYTNTLVYQFKHGYSYVPAIWFSWSNPSPAFPASPSVGNSATTFYPNGDDTGGDTPYQATQGVIEGGNSLVALVEYNSSVSGLSNVTQATIYAIVDTTYVNFYIIKETLGTVGGSVVPLYLAGTTLNIRCYIFVEPGTTSTY